MKHSRVSTKGKARLVLGLIGGLGMVAALTLAPVVVGVAQASPPATTATTVTTNATWTSSTGTGVLVECPVSTNAPYNYATLTGATWIWANKGQTRCKPTGNGPGTVAPGTVKLSRTFTVPGNPQGATLTLAADNGATVYINTTPTPVVTLSALVATPTNFSRLHPFTFTKALVHGPNTITIEGTNATGTGYDPAGVLAKLTVRSTSLQFSTEPGRTQTNDTIHSGVDSTGTSVMVKVVWTNETVDTTFSGTLTLSLVGNPSTSKLGGGTPVTVVTGIATFSTLKVNHAGSYRLVATATPKPGTSATPPTPATSTRFTIDTELVQCTPGHCTTSGSVTGNSVSETSTTPNAGYVALGFGGAPTFTCGTTKLLGGKYVATAEVLTTAGASLPQNGTTWTVTYTISKTIVKHTGPEGASQWQICFASTTTFTGLTGPAAPVTLTTGAGLVTYNVGLLRSCSKSVKAPCILSRHKTNAGQEVITVQVAGDAFIRP